MKKSKAQQAMEFVRREAAQVESATDLHNAFFGNGGEYGRLFPTRDEREAFAKTPEYREIVEIREAMGDRSKRTAGRR